MTPRNRRRAGLAEQQISGPAELILAVPYLLGFHPRESLVLVGLHERELVVTARLDLADTREPGLLRHTLSALSRGGTTALVPALFADSEASGAEAWSGFGTDLTGSADELGCEILDVLLVVGDRWRSLHCDEPTCCPEAGRRLPQAPTPFMAAAAYDGVVALPHRGALEAELEPLPACHREELDAAIAEAEAERLRAGLDGEQERFDRSVKRALFAACRAADEPGWPGIDDAKVARYGAALAVTAIRDAVWMAVDDRRLTGRALWAELSRRLPGPYVATALLLFGWSAWRAGNGASATVAAERALAADPHYAAADLLLAALSHGLDPRQVPRLRLASTA